MSFSFSTTETTQQVKKQKPEWRQSSLRYLYLKYVPNHIVKRFNDYIINNTKDPDIEKYILVFSNPKRFTLNGCNMLASKNYDGVIYLYNDCVTVITVEKFIDTLLTHDKNQAFLKTFILPELIEVNISYNDLISSTTGFVYTLEERFSKNSPLPKEITLKAKPGKSILMHNHVAGSVSKVLYKAIYGPFNGDKIINLQCLDQTLEWFIEGAYTGVFKFDETLTDHIDGANLLDYLEVLTKENLYQLLHAELFD
ncbi:hypothetical protein F-VV10_0200 [Faustovirus]|nr:hypothetical protein F-VV10_0200 [Faustovirus]